MKKLYELLGQREQPGTFGVEIECEGERLVEVNNDVWKTTNDGSLRGRFPDKSCEWVFQKPLPLGKAINALSSLAKAQRANKATLNFGFRTSAHVHINMQQMTEDQYLSFIYLYLLLENPLIRFCGPQRKANRFCLSINDGEGILDVLHGVFSQGLRGVFQPMENHIRYSALNLAATRKYGSLEVRSMRGTLDVDVLSTWLMALNNIRDFAMSVGNVRDVHDLFVRSKPEDFFHYVVGDVAWEFEYPELEADLRNNFSITLDLAYAYKTQEERNLGKGNAAPYVAAPGAPRWRPNPVDEFILPEGAVIEHVQPVAAGAGFAWAVRQADDPAPVVEANPEEVRRVRQAAAEAWQRFQEHQREQREVEIRALRQQGHIAPNREN